MWQNCVTDRSVAPYVSNFAVAAFISYLIWAWAVSWRNVHKGSQGQELAACSEGSFLNLRRWPRTPRRAQDRRVFQWAFWGPGLCSLSCLVCQGERKSPGHWLTSPWNILISARGDWARVGTRWHWFLWLSEGDRESCCPYTPLVCGQEHGSQLKQTGRANTFWELGKASLWSVSFLEASVGSWVCAADVFEHEKEPWQEPSICQTVSGAFIISVRYITTRLSYHTSSWMWQNIQLLLIEYSLI